MHAIVLKLAYYTLQENSLVDLGLQYQIYMADFFSKLTVETLMRKEAQTLYSLLSKCFLSGMKAVLSCLKLFCYVS